MEVVVPMVKESVSEEEEVLSVIVVKQLLEDLLEDPSASTCLLGEEGEILGVIEDVGEGSNNGSGSNCGKGGGTEEGFKVRSPTVLLSVEQGSIKQPPLFFSSLRGEA